jgi:hypothetical protein
MEFLKSQTTNSKDLKPNIAIYKHILENISNTEMLDWLFSGQKQIELDTIFDISSSKKHIYKIELYPPCLDTWIPYHIYSNYGYRYKHTYIGYISHLDKESILKSKFEKKIKKSIIIGLTEDKKRLEDYLKLDISVNTKIMVIHKLIMLGESYDKYITARNRKEFVESLLNINQYKDDLEIVKVWHSIKKTKLIDIYKSLNDNQKKKFDYNPYLEEIIKNLDKAEYQEMFDIIKIGIDYNKPIDKFNKKYAFTMVSDSPQLDYILKNTDIKEIIKTGFTITSDNFDLFMKLANKKEI